VRGSPIRTSSDQRSVGSSPRLLAASHVLHRLLVPRHPPCALNNLTQQNPAHRWPPAGETDDRRAYHRLLSRSQKMLASTVQFSTNKQPPPAVVPAEPRPPPGTSGPETGWPCAKAPAPPRAPRGTGPLPQDPTACLRPPTHPDPAPHTPRPKTRRCRTGGRPCAGGRTGQRSTLEHHPEHPRPPADGRPTPVRARQLDHPRAAGGPCSLERR
jgi:hypothetical protein